MARLARIRRSLSPLLCLLALTSLIVAAAGCDDGEDGGKQTNDTSAGSDTSTGTDTPSGDVTPVDVSGQTRTYRFSALQLSEPDIGVRQLLNNIILTAIDRPPTEPESVHILVRLSDWDTSATPPSLTLVAGAGTPADPSADPVSFRFRDDAELVEVAATYEDDEGLSKILHDDPTNLIFPLTVGNTTTLLPLRDIRLKSCYGTNRNCTGESEDLIFGWLTGAIILEEADTVEVELSEGGERLSLGSMLRDASTALPCTSDTECTGVRQLCNADGFCERKPDLEIGGKPAFSMAGTFKAVEVQFAE